MGVESSPKGADSWLATSQMQTDDSGFMEEHVLKGLDIVGMCKGGEEGHFAQEIWTRQNISGVTGVEYSEGMILYSVMGNLAAL